MCLRVAPAVLKTGKQRTVATAILSIHRFLQNTVHTLRLHGHNHNLNNQPSWLDFTPKLHWTASKQSLQPVQGLGPLQSVSQQNY